MFATNSSTESWRHWIRYIYSERDYQEIDKWTDRRRKSDPYVPLCLAGNTKATANVKVFQKSDKAHIQGHMINIYGTVGKPCHKKHKYQTYRINMLILLMIFFFKSRPKGNGQVYMFTLYGTLGNFWVQRVFTHWFLLNDDFENVSGIFTPIFYFSMLKRHDIIVLLCCNSITQKALNLQTSYFVP